MSLEPSGAPLRIAALVLTWNSADFIERCIASLIAVERPLHVLVVDNDSADNTVQLVNARFPSVEVMRTGANLGFAGGCNAGLRQLLDVGYDAILLLNPDAYVESGCIERLAEHFESDAGCGAVSPTILTHPDGVVWFGGGTIDWTTGSTYHEHQGEPVLALPMGAVSTERINGGAVLLRAAALRDIGLFDEDYFLYYEETDLSVRLERAGWGLHVQTAARAWHEASSSTGGDLGRVYNYYLTRGRLLFLRKLGHQVEWHRVLLHLARETRWLTKTFGYRRTAPAVAQRLRAVAHGATGRSGRVDF